jgi:chaperonin GroEL (HSP60 family)
MRHDLLISNGIVLGMEIVRKALRMPCATIAKNAGKDGSVIVEKVIMSPFEIGYDAQRDEFVDMVKAGIIDPTKVFIYLLFVYVKRCFFVFDRLFDQLYKMLVALLRY